MQALAVHSRWKEGGTLTLATERDRDRNGGWPDGKTWDRGGMITSVKLTIVLPVGEPLGKLYEDDQGEGEGVELSVIGVSGTFGGGGGLMSG